MKKLVLLVSTALVVGLVMYLQSLVSSAENTDTLNSGVLSGSTVSGTGTQTADEEIEVELDLLEQLASENEVFRWALETENAAENSQADGNVFSEPDPEDFRQWFESNETTQDWDNYVYWLKIYYGGNFVSQGWAKTGEEFIATSEHPESLRYVNVLGRVLASEWSKHKKIRKIGNIDMYRWGKQLNSGKVSLEQLSRTICDRLNGLKQ